MNRQEEYRQKYRELKKGWKPTLEIYREIIDDLVKPDSYLLDVGCGHGQLLKDVYVKTDNSYGMDPDAEALKKNLLIKNKLVGTVEKIPFNSEMFDVVVLEWVLEHLPNPHQAFAEIFRVLKPGGKVVFVTPNAWNYNTWIIRAIPNRFHSFFTRKLYGRQEGDTYPVQYKINTPGRMRKTLGSAGLKPVKIILNGDPSYISFNNFLFGIARGIERVLDLKSLNFGRVHIIGVFEKFTLKMARK